MRGRGFQYRLFTAAFVAIVCASNASAVTNYVDIGNAAPQAPYTNWAMAATNIQDAVDVCAPGGTVLIADGFYLLSETILVTNTITICGANGAETAIVDGNDAVRCMLITNCDAEVVGLTIQRGTSSNGAGIAAYGNAVIRDCIVRDNEVPSDSFVLWNYGGGIHLAGRDGFGVISNCVVEANRAPGGGGIYVEQGVVVDSVIWSNTARGEADGGGLIAVSSVVSRCSIAYNVAECAPAWCQYLSGGGASLCWSLLGDSTVTLNRVDGSGGVGGGVSVAWSSTVSNSVVSVNRVGTESDAGGSGGGLYVSDGSVVTHCAVLSNAAYFGGGGVRLQGGWGYPNEQLMDSDIEGNAATTWGGGVAAICGIVRRCRVYGNAAGTEGGGIVADDDRTVGAVEPTMIEECEVFGNQASGEYTWEGRGSGLSMVSGVGAVRNCRIYANTGVNAVRGGGVYLNAGAHMMNCTVVGNSTVSDGGGLYASGGAIYNNIIYHNQSGAGTSNHLLLSSSGASNNCSAPLIVADGTHVDADPMLTDVGTWDFRLASGSPCIDAGLDYPVVATDCAGIPRPLDGDNDTVARWDIGAHEFVHELADTDDDGLADTNELVRGTSPILADTDDDAMSDGDEVVAGTDPLDVASFFAFTTRIFADDAYVVHWPSASDRVYDLHMATNLPGEFSPLATNMAAYPPENTYTDAVSGVEQRFYRVSVKQE